jgi:hypothetical protein
MSLYLISLFLSCILLTQCLFQNKLDAFRRPEFYFFVSLFIYGNAGFLGHITLDISASFLEPYYTPDTYVKSYFLTLQALIGVYLGGQLYKKNKISYSIIPNKDIAIIAYFFCLLSIILAFYFFYSAGAYHGVSHSKVLEQKWIPYMLLITPAFSLLALYEKEKIYSLSVLLLFSAITFAAGSRRHVLLMIIIFIFAKILNKTLPNIKLICFILFLFIILGIIVKIHRGNASFEIFLNPGRLLVLLQYNFTEFVRPYASLLYYISTEGEWNYLYGQSFMDAIKRVPPGFLQFYELSERPGSVFAKIMYSETSMKRPVGQGFFGVTSAYMNFSQYGVFLFFYFFTLIIKTTGLIFVYNRLYFMLPILSITMFHIPRGGFQHLFYYTFYPFIFGIFIIFIYSLLKVACYKDDMRNIMVNSV